MQPRDYIEVIIAQISGIPYVEMRFKNGSLKVNVNHKELGWVLIVLVVRLLSSQRLVITKLTKVWYPRRKIPSNQQLSIVNVWMDKVPG